MENSTGFMGNASSKDFLFRKDGRESQPESFVMINCVINVPLMLIRHNKNAFHLFTVDEFAL